MPKIKIVAEVVFPVQVELELESWDPDLTMKSFEDTAIAEATMHFKNGAIAPIVANISVTKTD